MKHVFLFALLLLPLGSGILAAPASKANDSQQTADKSKQSPNNGVTTDRGEQVFTANCGRCHTPPNSISQRVTGTVVMHMRVRARLSREDEQALLRFLAP
jgi:cytochrome c5